MEIIIKKNYDERTDTTAQAVVDQLKSKPKSVFVFPADTTHAGMYDKLAKMCQEKKISFAEARAFHLDEYIGLDVKNPKSFRYLLTEKLFSKTDFDPKNIYLIDGNAEEIEKVKTEYIAKITDFGPVDLCILGIGRNGHIGFNEPGTDASLAMPIVDLDSETIEVNQGPSRAITLGIKTILSAKKIILSASGKAKAEAIKKAVKGTISSDCPASLLQNHPDVTFILDLDSASLL